MKKLLLLFLLVSASTYATWPPNPRPSIGDWISYTEKTTRADGAVLSSKFYNKYIEKFHDYYEKYLVIWTDHRNYGVTSQWFKEDELNYIDDIYMFCNQQQLNGFDAELTKFTIAAKKIIACRVVLNNVTTTWYSSYVPFGLVKKIEKFQDGKITKMFISDFLFWHPY